MKNIAALGMSAGVLGFPENPFYGFIADRFAKKGEEIITKNKEIFKEGYDTAIAAMHGVELGKLATPPKKDQLYLWATKQPLWAPFPPAPVSWLPILLPPLLKSWNT